MPDVKPSANKPSSRVVILTTGGTIAMRHDEDSGGAVPQLGAAEFSAALPSAFPEVETLEIANLPSSHFTLDVLRSIRDHVVEGVADPRVAGVVVTHGTDTMEETAYLLDLTVPTDKPMVLTGAMRTASDAGYDGYANLQSAVRVAAAAHAEGLGAVIVFNDEIHSARRVTKMHTLSPATFQSPAWGPIGRVEGGSVIVEPPPLRKTLPWRGLEPRVGLLKVALAAGPDLLEHMIDRGMRGVIIEALGGGRVPPWWLPVISAARAEGVAIVIASRCPSGRVWDAYGYEGAYRSLRDIGCLFAGGLNGQKARIKLMAVLAAAEGMEDIEALWGGHET